VSKDAGRTSYLVLLVCSSTDEKVVELLDQALELAFHLAQSPVHLLGRVVAPLALLIDVRLGQRRLRLTLQIAQQSVEALLMLMHNTNA
jgi:hypothetical protein